MVSKEVRICGGCSCCVVFITGIVLFAVSFGSVEPNEVALDLNTATYSLNTDKVFTSGRYFIGVGHRFIKFPRDSQTLRISLPARTQDGLAITLGIAFNYQLRVTAMDLTRLFYSFGEFEDVDAAYRRVALNTIREVAAEYTVFEYYRIRAVIIEQMLRRLRPRLAAMWGDLEVVQVLSVQVPREFDAARIAEDTAQQQASRAINDLGISRIDAETTVMRAQQQARVFVLEAEAQANAIRFDTDARIRSMQATMRAQAAAYKGLRDQLGLNSTELLAYAWNDVTSKLQGRGVVVNVAQPGSFQVSY